MNTSCKLDAQRLRCTPDRLVVGIGVVLALAWPVTGSADCVDTRKPTAAEADFHSRAMAALVAVLPPVPVGGKLQNADSVTALGQQCQGVTGDFNLQATRFYEHNYRKSIVSVAMNATKLPAPTALSAAYGAASPRRSAGLRVNNVVWTVSGSDSPLRQTLVDSIDRARLQAMVGQPLPSVAESRALAAQAVPATVAAGAAPAAAASTSSSSATSPGTEAAGPSASAPAAEPIKDAVDTVNKLRNLFGR